MSGLASTQRGGGRDCCLSRDALFSESVDYLAIVALHSVFLTLLFSTRSRPYPISLPSSLPSDIKSANILLSDDGYSKVADFGLCKEAPIGAGSDGSEQLVPTATAVRGSFGYLDPEYVNTSILSEKSDVYSYGVVLLELISGHKSIHEWQPLAYWVSQTVTGR